MTVDPMRPSRVTRQGPWPVAGAVEALARARRRAAGSLVVRYCSKQGVMWTLRLLLRRSHPWPHRCGAGPGIVEGVPHQGAPAVVVIVVAEATGAVVLAFPLPLALTLAFVVVVGLGAGGGGLA
jgi:hypothetical protein